MIRRRKIQNDFNKKVYGKPRQYWYFAFKDY